MADLEFNTTEGRTIARELLIAYLNTGTPEEPVWSAIGKRVEESDEEMDWSEESIKDIFGNTWTTLTKPVITQSFDPIPLDAGDVAGESNFAERYSGASVSVTRIGGAGGGNLEISCDITYGGTRTLGTVSNSAGTVTFKADGAA